MSENLPCEKGTPKNAPFSLSDAAKATCEHYDYVLSAWGNDEEYAASFFNGFFAAMETFGIAYPVGTSDIHARAIWATRWLLATEIKPDIENRQLPSEPLDEKRELRKAHLILEHLQFDTDAAKSFVAGATPPSEDSERFPNVVYYDPKENPDIIYTDYNDPSFSDEERQRLMKVCIFRAKFMDGTDFLIRSDDAIMMRALTERVYS